MHILFHFKDLGRSACNSVSNSEIMRIDSRTKEFEQPRHWDLVSEFRARYSVYASLSFFFLFLESIFHLIYLHESEMNERASVC